MFAGNAPGANVRHREQGQTIMAQNRTYDELAIGETASLTRVLRANDLFVFAHASGNINPVHIPDID